MRFPAEASPDAIFAWRVRVLREATGLTQRQLADKMTAAGHRMHQTTIAKIESGERPVYVGEAVALAGSLEVGVADLIQEPLGRVLMPAMAEGRRWRRTVNDLTAEEKTLQERLAAVQAQLPSATKRLDGALARVQALREGTQ